MILLTFKESELSRAAIRRSRMLKRSSIFWNGYCLQKSRGPTRLGPKFPSTGVPFYLTLISQDEIVFQGEYAQPGPGEFIIESFATWPLVGGADFFLFTRQ